VWLISSPPCACTETYISRRVLEGSSRVRSSHQPVDPPPPELYFFALRSYVAAVVMRRFSHPKSQNPGHFFFLFFFPFPPLEKCIHATPVAIHVLFLMSDAWKEKERD